MTPAYRPVLRFAENRRGRDFVVGDIHGAFEQVHQALQAVAFNREVDRLFCAGDLVNRGPVPERVAKFLKQPYVHAVRGNHEEMILDLYAQGVPSEIELIFRVREAPVDLGWWLRIKPEDRLEIVELFRRLPVAIEIETRRGLVGIVHADVPQGFSWQRFTRALEGEGSESHRRAVRLHACWSRERHQRRDHTGVPGIGRVFVGHTPKRARPLRLGNVHYIDGGLVYGVVAQDPTAGRLVIADITASCIRLAMDPMPGTFVDARVDRQPVYAPFEEGIPEEEDDLQPVAVRAAAARVGQERELEDVVP